MVESSSKISARTRRAMYSYSKGTVETMQGRGEMKDCSHEGTKVCWDLEMRAKVGWKTLQLVPPYVDNYTGAGRMVVKHPWVGVLGVSHQRMCGYRGCFILPSVD